MAMPWFLHVIREKLETAEAAAAAGWYHRSMIVNFGHQYRHYHFHPQLRHNFHYHHRHRHR